MEKPRRLVIRRPVVISVQDWADHIAMVRRELNLPQAELANLTGFTQVTVSNWENARRPEGPERASVQKFNRAMRGRSIKRPDLQFKL